MVTELVWTAVYVLGGWLLLKHLVAPLFTYWLYRGPDRYSFTPVDVEMFMSERSEHFHHLDSEMRSLGFSPIVASALALSHSVTFFALYRNSLDPCAAMIMSGTNKLGETLVLDFTQRYADGVHLSVTNSPMPWMYPRWRKKVMLQLSKIREPRLLYEKFKNIRTKSNLFNPTALPVGRELQIVEEYLNEELQELVAKGFMKLEGGQQRPTLKAAYVMSWRMTWPWKPLLTFISDQRAASLSKA